LLSDSAIKTPQALYLTSIATVSRLFGQIEQLATLTMRHLQEESGAETSTHSANARNTLLVDLLEKIASTVKALAAQPSWALYDTLIKLVKGDKRCGRFIECFFLFVCRFLRADLVQALPREQERSLVGRNALFQRPNLARHRQSCLCSAYVAFVYFSFSNRFVLFFPQPF